MGELIVTFTLPDGSEYTWTLPHLTVTHDISPSAQPRLVRLDGRRMPPPMNALNVPLEAGDAGRQFILALENAYRAQTVEVPTAGRVVEPDA